MQTTLTPIQLRKCYGRAMLCCLILILLTAILGGVLSVLYAWVLEPLLWTFGIPVHNGVATIVINDLVSYLPVLIAIPMTIGMNPPAPPLPVRPLPRQELLRAIPFCIGVLYLLAYATDGLIALLELLSGLQTSNALDTLANLPLSLYFVSAVVIAPICEELLFRKLFLERCRILGDASAVLLSAAAFALMHENLYQLFYAFGVGICLGCVALMTGRVRECILIHACVNAVSCLFMISSHMLWHLALTLLIFACIGCAFYLFSVRRGRYHFDPGPLPYTPEEKRHACASSPCFWICGILCLAECTVIIFFR